MPKKKSPRQAASRAVLRLREHMSQSGETQQTLATKLGCCRAHVSYLIGGSTLPSLHLAVIIEDQLDIPCREWFDS